MTDELVVGWSVLTPGRTVDESLVSGFAGLTGDFTPIHIDETFARTTAFGRRIAHGALTMSLAIGSLAQTGMLGARVIALVDIKWNFQGVVKIGDTVRSRIAVEHMRPTRTAGRDLVAFRFEVLNQEDRTVQSGTILVLVRSSEQVVPSGASGTAC